LRYGAYKVFGTHRFTHSLTDGQTRLQYASGAVFQPWRMISVPFFRTAVGRITYLSAHQLGAYSKQSDRLFGKISSFLH